MKVIKTIGWIIIALVLIITLTSEPDVIPTSAKERAAQFKAQEKYDDVLGRYGDKDGAELSARLTYENEVS